MPVSGAQTASSTARSLSQPCSGQAIMDILSSTKTVHDFGEFKEVVERGFHYHPARLSIPVEVSRLLRGASKATSVALNIMIVDDPVTADNSSSELERERLRSWYEQAAATCPYPLPLKMERYLRKLFLIGTTFHMDDLYHTCLRSGMYKHLWLKAVDLKTGETLSPRFTYRSREELKVSAETNEQDALLLENVEKGKIISWPTIASRTAPGLSCAVIRTRCAMIPRPPSPSCGSEAGRMTGHLLADTPDALRTTSIMWAVRWERSLMSSS